MSLEGGFDKVERIFLQPSILSFQLRDPRFQLHDLGLQRAIAASINLATSCCVNRLGILL